MIFDEISTSVANFLFYNSYWFDVKFKINDVKFVTGPISTTPEMPTAADMQLAAAVGSKGNKNDIITFDALKYLRFFNNFNLETLHLINYITKRESMLAGKLSLVKFDIFN